MRSPRLALLSMLAIAACGDSDGTDGPTACEVGPDIVSDATARLVGNQPQCSQDDECVFVALKAHCEGYSSDLCYAIVHRATASRWDESQICRAIDQASVPGEYSCGAQASCADTGTPVCRAGRCVGSKD
jgi:hypothetical protein